MTTNLPSGLSLPHPARISSSIPRALSKKRKAAKRINRVGSEGHECMMDTKTHWEKVYATKAPDAVSWYRPHLETSLALIERAARSYAAAIIDVGGGESTLVDDLLLRGFRKIAVLDVSQTAIDVTTKRLGEAAQQVNW